MEYIHGDINYCIDEFGNVLSTRRDKYLVWIFNQRGYVYIKLYNKHYFIHRLVAQTYLPDWDDSLFINHKDGNKLNNHVTNLEMVTHKQNIQHAIDLGLFKNKRKLSLEQVRYIKQNLLNSLDNITISKLFKVAPSTICHIRSGRTFYYVR